MTDPTGSTTYAYERHGLPRLENRTVQGNAYALSYAYDQNANRRQVTYPSGLVVNYTHDFADRPLSAAPASGTAFVTSAKYRPFGPLEQIKYGNATTKTMDYDSRYRPILNKLEKDSPLTTLAHYTLTPDPVGNIDAIADVQNAAFNRTFDYDDLHRLTVTNSGASLWGNGSTVYDRMGNLTSLTLGTARTATFAYVGTTPKLSSVTESGGIGTRNVTYDSAGNETAVGAGGLTYSSRNYLASGEGFSYAYDGNGLRCIATNASARRYSFYSPEMNLLSETYLTTLATPPIQHEYVWFAGQPVGQIDDGTPDVTSWSFTDHLGTPFIQTDSAANLIWRAEYEPYGRIFALRTANRYQPLRLPGQEAEETNVLSANGNGATERSYNVFRWYRNRWGRYSQMDPLHRDDSLLAAQPLHPYWYAEDRPGVFVDPHGLTVQLPSWRNFVDACKQTAKVAVPVVVAAAAINTADCYRLSKPCKKGVLERCACLFESAANQPPSLNQLGSLGPGASQVKLLCETKGFRCCADAFMECRNRPDRRSLDDPPKDCTTILAPCTPQRPPS